MQEEPFISLDSAFPGTMENKSSLEAATSLLLNTVSECLEHNRFFFQARTNYIFFSFSFLKYILLPNSYNWSLSQQEEEFLENACMWREGEKEKDSTLYRNQS